MEIKANLPPKTEVMDWLAFAHLESQLMDYLQKGLCTPDEFHSFKRRLNLEFMGRLHSQDRYTFPTVPEMTEFLRNTLHLTETELLKVAEHELEHYNEAILRGYQPRAGVWLSKDRELLAYRADVEVKGRMKTEDIYAVNNTFNHRRDHHLD